MKSFIAERVPTINNISVRHVGADYKIKQKK
jgi:hypothetical protein